MQTVVVESEGYGSRAEKDKLSFKVPKRTTIRAVLPRSQTGPCLLACYTPRADMRRLASLVVPVGAVTLPASPQPPSLPTRSLQPRANVLRTNEFSVGVLGEISTGADGEYVVVKGKECGIPGAFFRALGGATTLPGGRYEASVPIRTKTTLRAEWGDDERDRRRDPAREHQAHEEPTASTSPLTNEREAPTARE